MAQSITSPDLLQTLTAAQSAAGRNQTRQITVDGQQKTIPFPFPSPVDWRDSWIYFLMIDRFANPANAPKGTWNQIYPHRQGGTFQGVRDQLGYLQELGVKALWLSPVLKNSRPDFDYNYHGYGIQDFLNVDERFASDGTRETAERELTELVDEAHARGMYVIFDIVLNHAGRVFDYRFGNHTVTDFQDHNLLEGPPGGEPQIEWLNGLGAPREDWTDTLPDPAHLAADDVIWPEDLQNRFFFRRRGAKTSDSPDARGFVPGDFSNLRQLVAEYDATVPGQEDIRAKYGAAPVIGILIRAYQYLIAKYDIDGYRIDTVKYVQPDAVRNFGNAMREFGLSIGKKNFFTFGEIYDNEQTIANFVGRRTEGGEGFGIDAALDFPLFFKLPAIVRGNEPVEALRGIFETRKAAELGRLSSHGEAGRYFVTFLDNHDQNQRIQHPLMPPEQVDMALALLFAMQGIPCIYYGTEQGLQGTVNADGSMNLTAPESTREALWGKTPTFDKTHPRYRKIQQLAALRNTDPALAYGRLYFREAAGADSSDFGLPAGAGGVVAFSRILGDREVLVVANTSSTVPFRGSVIVDRDMNATPRRMVVAFSNAASSNQGTRGTGIVQHFPNARFFANGGITTGPATALPVILSEREVQILVPV